MAYLVRKINKRKNIDLLCGDIDVDALTADMPTGEFRTTESCLSTWFIDSLDKLDDAVLAIAVTSSKVSKMEFIVIDTEILRANNLEFKQTDAGMEIAVPDLQNTHYDILDITLAKLKDCVLVYKEVVDQDEQGRFIVRYAAGQIKELMKTAIDEDRVSVNKAEGEIKRELIRLSGGSD